MPPHTLLNGVNNNNDNHILEVLHQNLKEFFNWGLLEAGYYSDSEIDDLGTADDSPSTLKVIYDSNLALGSVWQAPYRNWVYESNLESNRQPISVSGVYINGDLAIQDYYIDYRNGTVHFSSPIPTNSTVQISYSNKDIGIYDDSVPWFRNIILDAFDYLQPSKEKEILDRDGIQTPFILIESIPSRSFKAREMGNFSQWISQDFLFHVVAEDKSTRNNLVDIISNQIDKPIRIFDTNKRDEDNLFNLDYNGTPTGSGMLYPELVEDSSPYLLRLAYFTKMVPQSVSQYLPLFRAVIKVTVTVENF